MSPRTFLAIFCFAAGARAQAPAPDPDAGRTVAIAPIPDWVEPVPLDVDADADPAEADGGRHHLLMDEQTDARSGYVGFRRYARKFVTEAGIQDGSQVDVSFDPSYQSLVFHTLRIHRGGDVIDRLKPGGFRVVEREEQHDRQIYDRNLTAIAVVEDVRVGDVLEYAFTVSGANPVFGGRFYDTFSTSFSVPLRRRFQRLLWDDARPLEIRSHAEASGPDVRRRDGTADYRWSREHSPAVRSPAGVPPWHDTHGWVEMSEYRTWGEVVDWALPLYESTEGLPPDMEAAAAEMSRIGDEAGRAAAALRFVQDKIRYVGMVDGVHSHRPHPVAEIARRRFGDCKDKTTLLVALLRRLGLDARPALVDTDVRRGIAGWLPSPYAFDHVVTRVRIGGADHWVDPTDSFQRGTLDRIAVSDFGLALVVAPGETGLTEVRRSAASLPGTEIAEVYTLEDYRGTAKLDVVTVYRGSDADGIRAWFADNSRSGIEKSYTEFYAKDYPAIEVREPRILPEDDEAANRFTVREHYLIRDFWTPSDDDPERMEADFYPRVLADKLDAPAARARREPYRTSHPVDIVQTIEVRFPNALGLEDEETSVRNEAFEYSCSKKRKGTTYVMRHAYRTLAEVVEPGRFVGYARDAERADAATFCTVWVPAAYARSFPTRQAPEESGGGESRFRPNLPIAIGAMLAFSLGVIPAAFLLVWKPAPLGNRTIARSTRLQGLGGWLVLVVLRFVLTPLAMFVLIAVNLCGFDNWTASGGAGTFPDFSRGQWALGLETLAYALLLPVETAATILLFRKRTAFPRAAIALYAAGALVEGGLLALAAGDPALFAGVGKEQAKSAGRTLVGAMIWIPYLLVSVRVRSTFVRGPQPEPPPPPAADAPPSGVPGMGPGVVL